MIGIEDFKAMASYLLEVNSPHGMKKEWTRSEDMKITNFLEKVSVHIDGPEMMFEWLSYMFLERNRVKRGSLPSISHLTAINTAKRYFNGDEESRKARWKTRKTMYEKLWICPVGNPNKEVFSADAFLAMRERNRATGNFLLCFEYLPYIYDFKDCRKCIFCTHCSKAST